MTSPAFPLSASHFISEYHLDSQTDFTFHKYTPAFSSHHLFLHVLQEVSFFIALFCQLLKGGWVAQDCLNHNFDLFWSLIWHLLLGTSPNTRGLSEMIAYLQGVHLLSQMHCGCSTLDLPASSSSCLLEFLHWAQRSEKLLMKPKAKKASFPHSYLHPAVT